MKLPPDVDGATSALQTAHVLTAMAGFTASIALFLWCEKVQ